jgi:putative transposase
MSSSIARTTGASLKGELFDTLEEASVAIEQGRRPNDTVRPQTALGAQPPAPGDVIWSTEPSRATSLLRPAIVTRLTMH